MKASTDETLFHAALMDTPFSAPREPKSREDAFATVGCHVTVWTGTFHEYRLMWECD